jgi:hypothetical protein
LNNKNVVALVATFNLFVAVPAFAQDGGTADAGEVQPQPEADPSENPVLWGGSTESACRTALEGASCGPTSADSRRTFQRLARVCGREFGSVIGSNSALFAEFQSLWRSCVADTPPPASAAEVPGSVARCALDGQTPRLRCGGSSDGSPDGQGGGGGDTPRSTTRTRYVPFCGPGTRAVQDERGRTRCECIDPRHLIQRVETRWSVPTEIEGLAGAQAAASRYDRRHSTDERSVQTRIVILGCANPGPMAQDGLIDRITRIEERVTVLERRACYDANGQRHEDVPQECRDIWSLMIDVATNRVNIGILDRRVTELETDVRRLLAQAELPCHIPLSQMEQMSDAEQQDYCRRHPGTDSGAGLANLLHFQVGIGGLGIARLHMDVTSLYAMVFVQWEPMFSDSIGLYVRATVGYGTLGDPDHRYGQVAIGESGAFGLSGGLAARLIQEGEGAERRSVLTLNVGAAFLTSLVEGRRGRATGTYRWHDFGIEARLRWQPIRHFGIGAMLGLTWDRAQVERPDSRLNSQGFPDFFDEDGAAILFGLELGGTF